VNDYLTRRHTDSGRTILISSNSTVGKAGSCCFHIKLEARMAYNDGTFPSPNMDNNGSFRRGEFHLLESLSEGMLEPKNAN